MIGKNWVHLKSNTPQMERGPFQKERLALKYGVVNNWEDYSNYSKGGVENSRNWATDHCLPLRTGLRTFMPLVGVLCSLLKCCNECILRLRV